MTSQNSLNQLAVFPQEILDLIFEEVYLLETDGYGRAYFSSLNSASLLNQGSYIHARKLRFQAITLSQTSGPGSSEHLLRLIQANPLIANDIRALQVQEKTLDGVSAANEWEAQRTTMYTDPELGALLCILRNLSKLYLTGLNPAWVINPAWRNDAHLPVSALEALNRNIAALQSGLTNIEHLRLQYLAVDTPSDFTSLLASYPRLRSLDLMNIDIREITEDGLTDEIEHLIGAYESQSRPFQVGHDAEDLPYHYLPVGRLEIDVPAFLDTFPQIQCLDFTAQFASDMVLLEHILGPRPMFPNLEKLTLGFRAHSTDTYNLLVDFLRVPSIREALKYLDLSKCVVAGRSALPTEALPLPPGLNHFFTTLRMGSRWQTSHGMLKAIAQTMSMRASDPTAVPLHLSLGLDIKYLCWDWDVDLREYLSSEGVQERLKGRETDDGVQFARALFADDDSDDEEYEPPADNSSDGSSSSDDDDDDDVDATVGASELEFCRDQILLHDAVSMLDRTIADVGLNLQALGVEFVNRWGAIIEDSNEPAFWNIFRQNFPATAARFQSMRTS